MKRWAGLLRGRDARTTCQSVGSRLRLGLGPDVHGSSRFVVSTDVEQGCGGNQGAELAVSIIPRVEVRVPVDENVVDGAELGPVVVARARLYSRQETG